MFASLSSASTRVPALDMICLTMSWTLSQPTLLFHSSSLGWSYRSFMMWKEFLRVTHPGGLQTDPWPGLHSCPFRGAEHIVVSFLETSTGPPSLGLWRSLGPACCTPPGPPSISWWLVAGITSSIPDSRTMFPGSPGSICLQVDALG